ncbi:hypothetical protein CA236_15035 [Sphingomonas sp. ABOLG]|uniref:hypothetical protein n=1 Tax=Sphingomonas sp. ABOLG TaxID=1985880 RepID=UPI000F7E5317|nr:hypothetical protein [Sphingomonas sp. ABOLG]RSV15321.1 hypothetical protein CA236_15035 [Sphingomonas sp. ABOLG]
MYNNAPERRLAEARALSGALALADLAGWNISPSSSLILPPPFRNYLHVEQAQLLLVPSIEPSRCDLEIVGRGMREARCDALVVKASSEGRRTLCCDLGKWGRQGNNWKHSRRLWLSHHNEAWLVPDPAEPVEVDLFYRLTPGPLRIGFEPFICADPDIDAGLDRADAYLAAVWGDR